MPAAPGSGRRCRSPRGRVRRGRAPTIARGKSAASSRPCGCGGAPVSATRPRGREDSPGPTPRPVAAAAVPGPPGGLRPRTCDDLSGGGRRDVDAGGETGGCASRTTSSSTARHRVPPGPARVRLSTAVAPGPHHADRGLLVRGLRDVRAAVPSAQGPITGHLQQLARRSLPRPGCVGEERPPRPDVLQVLAAQGVC